jgi:transcriptional regulator GlxA family with amidase domain
MRRREFIGTSIAASIALFGGARSASGQAAAAAPLPRREQVKVAFMVGEWTNIIDTAGPWEVFSDTMVERGGGHRNVFDLYTVGPADRMYELGGIAIKPHYTIANAPQPHVIVVPAHKATDESIAWLRKASAGTDVTVSICTGAFKLAQAGLLEGLPATTHHDYFDSFAEQFPDIELRRGLRFVDSGRIATAGGLTSGIDLALHIVSRYCGVEAAERTAAYMEYASDAWRA